MSLSGAFFMHVLMSQLIKIFYYVYSCLSYQVHTLLKGLEKIAASADIPMLVCGDFNSVPGRSVYALKYS